MPTSIFGGLTASDRLTANDRLPASVRSIPNRTVSGGLGRAASQLSLIDANGPYLPVDLTLCCLDALPKADVGTHCSILAMRVTADADLAAVSRACSIASRRRSMTDMMDGLQPFVTAQKDEATFATPSA
jgi:hypothetical protein